MKIKRTKISFKDFYLKNYNLFKIGEITENMWNYKINLIQKRAKTLRK